VDWIGLAQDRDKWRVVMNRVLNLRSIKCFEIIECPNKYGSLELVKVR
jgi:hypothetical protein